ncbi:GH1 family beta-glucosidase [Microbacterium sp. LRZ72]|uniref:GH1 family beta-glucosidase n=1 Tax=Microbacterium sp. LRZ72 TaxID=2942481 RepID=UPI0029BD9F35|nr:GH1 family beta-glucosidase [Microbacterium sp. LRZ72]MDX2377857.1 GH1 family beta-glucosidase [Microbacterium sp. LRZ72]
MEQSPAPLPFPHDFLWGVSTAAYQIEGAAAEDGRGPSIWDTFSHEAGRVLHGDTGDVATDHYHRLDEDLDLLAELGTKVYRFSFSWSRVLPSGRGTVNEAGLTFYDRLIDGLLARGIRPVATLYHWDLPQALDDEGGWEERSTVEAFAEYATLMGRRYGDRVSMWTTINEPWVLTYLGYAVGAHAPGKTSTTAAARVHHNILLAHAAGAAALRETVTDASIGIALNMSEIYPATDTAASRDAAALAFDQLVTSFLAPLMGGEYPANLVGYSELWSADGDIVAEDDLPAIARQRPDWLSINEYHPRYVVAPEDLDTVRRDGWVGESGTPFTIGQPFVDVTRGSAPKSIMGWILEPQGLRDILIKVSQLYPDLPLYVSENGFAGADYLDQTGEAKDPERIDYLRGHIAAAGEAIAAGVDLRGYFLWSFLDNFEWAEGYLPRFGITYVDYPTGRRTPKSSFHWYRRVIQSNAISGGSH